MTAATARMYMALIDPATVQLSYMWLSASTMPSDIIEIGNRATAPEMQNALAPGMRNSCAYGDCDATDRLCC